MANAEGEEESTYDGSLMPAYTEVVRTRLGGKPRVSISRVLCCTALPHVGEVPTDDFVGLEQKKIIEGLGLVTGLMLIQNGTVVNLIEGSADDVMEVLRSIASMPYMTTTRIVASAEDCPARCFTPWNFRVIDHSGGDGADIKDDLVNESYGCYSRFLDIGKTLLKSKVSHGELVNALDKVVENYEDKIPKSGLVETFAHCDGIQSLKEYMELFDFPVKVQIQAERAWPIQPLVQY
jgi:hypothetical protein